MSRRQNYRYGKMNTGKKVHKTGNPWGTHLSLCGGAILDKKFNSIKNYGSGELCKRCFTDIGAIKFKRKVQKVLHLEEDLFKI